MSSPTKLFEKRMKHILESELLRACKTGDKDAIAQLVDDKHVALDCCDELNGLQPLMIACKYGHFEIVKYLLWHNTDILDNVDAAGWSALHWSILHGHYSIAKELVEFGADSDLKSKYDHIYPLHLSILYNQPNLTKLLLDNNCKLDIYYNNLSILELLHYLQYKTDTDSPVQLSESDIDKFHNIITNSSQYKAMQRKYKKPTHVAATSVASSPRLLLSDNNTQSMDDNDNDEESSDDEKKEEEQDDKDEESAVWKKYLSANSDDEDEDEEDQNKKEVDDILKKYSSNISVDSSDSEVSVTPTPPTPTPDLAMTPEPDLNIDYAAEDNQQDDGEQDTQQQPKQQYFDDGEEEEEDGDAVGDIMHFLQTQSVPEIDIDSNLVIFEEEEEDGVYDDDTPRDENAANNDNNEESAIQTGNVEPTQSEHEQNLPQEIDTELTDDIHHDEYIDKEQESELDEESPTPVVPTPVMSSPSMPTPVTSSVVDSEPVVIIENSNEAEVNLPPMETLTNTAGQSAESFISIDMEKLTEYIVDRLNDRFLKRSQFELFEQEQLRHNKLMKEEQSSSLKEIIDINRELNEIQIACQQIEKEMAENIKRRLDEQRGEMENLRQMMETNRNETKRSLDAQLTKYEQWLQEMMGCIEDSVQKNGLQIEGVRSMQSDLSLKYCELNVRLKMLSLRVHEQKQPSFETLKVGKIIELELQKFQRSGERSTPSPVVSSSHQIPLNRVRKNVVNGHKKRKKMQPRLPALGQSFSEYITDNLGVVANVNSSDTDDETDDEQVDEEDEFMIGQVAGKNSKRNAQFSVSLTMPLRGSQHSAPTTPVMSTSSASPSNESVVNYEEDVCAVEDTTPTSNSNVIVEKKAMRRKRSNSYHAESPRKGGKYFEPETAHHVKHAHSDASFTYISDTNVYWE